MRFPSATHLDDEAFELATVPDGGAVEELASDRSDPALSERVGDWGVDRCFEDLEDLGAEDLVEGVDELATSISNQRS